MTSPTPSVPGLEQSVRDLQRRVKELETGAAARPAATSVPVAAYPWSAGDTARWAGFSSLDYRIFYHWWVRMEWATLDVAIVGTTSGDRSGQWRITCNDQVLHESALVPGSTANVVEEAQIDLTPVLQSAPTVPGSLRKFTLEGRVVGGSAGGFFAVPERLLLRGARFT